MIIVLIVLLSILLIIILREVFGEYKQDGSNNRRFRFYGFLNTASIKGRYAEMGVSNRLGRMGEEYKVFNDVMVRCSWGTAQIDHVVVSKYGIFVIETKNYQGKHITRFNICL